MSTEQTTELARRATVHAALADPARLRISDALADTDLSPSELAAMLAMPSNLLAHHLGVLERAGIIIRRRSQGDRRRTYLRLVPGARHERGGPGGAAGAARAVRVHHLPLRRLRPRHISEIRHDGDLVVTVCDLAYEELGALALVHWSVPDPVPAGDPATFDAALAELADRVSRLAPRLAAAS